MKFVNPHRLCDLGEHLSLSLPLSSFTRIADIALNFEDSLEADLHFINRDNQLLVEGCLTGTVALECQKCLRSFNFDLSENIAWRLVEANKSYDEDYLDFDDIEFSSSKLVLFENLQDELIMAMPFNAVCQNTDCDLIYTNFNFSDKDLLNAKAEFANGDTKGKKAEGEAQCKKQLPFAGLKDIF